MFKLKIENFSKDYRVAMYLTISRTIIPTLKSIEHCNMPKSTIRDPLRTFGPTVILQELCFEKWKKVVNFKEN